jgi:hypothetical protein
MPRRLYSELCINVRHQFNATRDLGQRDRLLVYPPLLHEGCKIGREEKLLEHLINKKMVTIPAAELN